MDELGGLPHYRGDYLRVTVAGYAGSQTGDEINVFPAFIIPEARAVAAHEEHRQPVIGVHDEVGLLFLSRFQVVIHVFLQSSQSRVELAKTPSVLLRTHHSTDSGIGEDLQQQSVLHGAVDDMPSAHP